MISKLKCPLSGFDLLLIRLGAFSAIATLILKLVFG